MIAERRAMGWSMAVAAQHLGVNRSARSDWERTGVIVWKRYRDLVGAGLNFRYRQRQRGACCT